jgi:hypothetical protein
MLQVQNASLLQPPYFANDARCIQPVKISPSPTLTSQISGDVDVCVDIQDSDGDQIRFQLSETSDRVRLFVNDDLVLDSVIRLAADDETGLVRDMKGVFCIPVADRASKLTQLRALLARVGVVVAPLRAPNTVPALPASPVRTIQPCDPSSANERADSREGVQAVFAEQRAWVELGVPTYRLGRAIVPLRASGADSEVDTAGGAEPEKARDATMKAASAAAAMETTTEAAATEAAAEEEATDASQATAEASIEIAAAAVDSATGAEAATDAAT